MSNLMVIVFIFFVFLILIYFLFFYKKTNNRGTKKDSFDPSLPILKGKEDNPDVNTQNWDLHKKRLMKFGRSQYKGLTFFVSSEDKIYYLSEEGNRVYC